jgi:hypothetical protein
MHTLRSLIAAGETDGISHAEQAIDEMLATAPADQHKASPDSVRSLSTRTALPAACGRL